MKITRKLKGKELEDFIGDHKGLIAALFDSKNSYYCDTCDGLRVKGHQCTCLFCKQSFPDSDKHKNCPELAKYKKQKEVKKLCQI